MRSSYPRSAACHLSDMATELLTMSLGGGVERDETSGTSAALLWWLCSRTRRSHARPRRARRQGGRPASPRRSSAPADVATMSVRAEPPPPTVAIVGVRDDHGGRHAEDHERLRPASPRARPPPARPRSSLPIGASSMTLTRVARETDAESLVDPRVAKHGGTRKDPKANYDFPGMMDAASWRRTEVHKATRWYGCALFRRRQRRQRPPRQRAGRSSKSSAQSEGRSEAVRMSPSAAM